MKVLFVSLKYAYGKPEWGFSHEYLNLYDTLKNMSGIQASLFAIDERMAAVGQEAMNAELIQTVEEQKPEVMFCQLFTEEIYKKTIAYITQHTHTKTINWFADDHFRFHTFSKYWAPLFSLVTTTDRQSLSGYARMGVNAFLTQWAVNPHKYRPDKDTPTQVREKITFVGQRYGQRKLYLEALSAAGLPVEFFGFGWNGGVIDFETMLAYFTQSAICLNFTESPHGGFAQYAKLAARFLVRKELGRLKFNAHHLVDTALAIPGYLRPQIKGRIFEILGCGGFLLTGAADCLSEYYEPGKELVVFKNREEMLSLSEYYLSQPQERARIASAGYMRTLAEHTYEQRLLKIFDQLN